MFGAFKTFDKPLEAIAPSCTEGPSLPSDRPPKEDTNPPMVLVKSSFNQLASIYPFTSPVT